MALEAALQVVGLADVATPTRLTSEDVDPVRHAHDLREMAPRVLRQAQDALPCFVWLPSTGNWGNFSEQFRMRPRGVPRASESEGERKPRASRVSAIQRAHEFQRLLDSGEVKNRAEIARRYGVSRARVTQMMNLLKLPREILDCVAGLSEEEQLRFSERCLRAVAGLRSEAGQLKAFEQLRSARS